LRPAGDRGDRMVHGTKGEQCSVQYFCQISSGRNKNLSSGQRRQVSYIRFQAVLADQHRRDAAAALCQRLHVERMALAIGDKQHVARLRQSQHAIKLSADLGAAARLAECPHKRGQIGLALFPGPRRADKRKRVVEFPQVDHIGLLDRARDTSQRSDRDLMLGPIRTITRARLLHRSRMVDQDGEVEWRLAGRRRLNAQRDGTSIGGAANQIARRPAGHFQVDRRVEPDLCVPVLQRAANQHGAAATALHRQIGERQRATVSQII